MNIGDWEIIHIPEHFTRKNPARECLEGNWITSLEDALIKIEAWRKDYNENRPNNSLEDKTHRGF